MKLAVAAAILAILPATARADDRAERGAPVAAMRDERDLPPPREPPGEYAPKRKRMKHQLEDLADEVGNELGAHLGVLSAGTVSLHVDARTKTVRVGFGLDGDDLGFRFRSDVRVVGGVAAVDARLDLRLVGRDFHLELPDFEVAQQRWQDQRWVELRLPLLSGTF